MPLKLVTTHVPVDFNRRDDFLCCYLASIGMSTNLICEKTGLTKSQVAYRLKKVQVKRADYRHGRTAVARTLIGTAGRQLLDAHVRSAITKELKKYGEELRTA